MDWFKIYGKHVSSPEFTDSEIGKLVRYQAKVAHHERLLTDRETRAIFTRNSQRITEEKLKFVENFTEISLEFIANKVLEDVLRIRKRYSKDVEFHAQQREKRKSDRDDSRDDSRYDDRDIDKIREDKRIYIEQFETLWAGYPNKKGRAKAEKKYIKLANDDSGIYKKMKDAIACYSEECLKEKREPKFIQHGSSFFNGSWQDYVDMKTDLDSGKFDRAKRYMEGFNA